MTYTVNKSVGLISLMTIIFTCGGLYWQVNKNKADLQSVQVNIEEIKQGQHRTGANLVYFMRKLNIDPLYPMNEFVSLVDRVNLIH